MLLIVYQRIQLNLALPSKALLDPTTPTSLSWSSVSHICNTMVMGRVCIKHFNIASILVLQALLRTSGVS